MPSDRKSTTPARNHPVSVGATTKRNGLNPALVPAGPPIVVPHDTALYRCIGCDNLFGLEETGATWFNPRKGLMCWCEGCKPTAADVVRAPDEPYSTVELGRFG